MVGGDKKIRQFLFDLEQLSFIIYCRAKQCLQDYPEDDDEKAKLYHELQKMAALLNEWKVKNDEKP
jgi:RNA binding exosome subunit